MLNNFMKDEYQNSHLIIKPESGRGGLVLGDFNSVTDKQVLQGNNIKTIITAADGMQHLKIDPAIKHVTFPLQDIKSEKISIFFNQSYNLIQQNLRRGGVLVHCAAGISRSATLVIAYLMKKNKWTFKEAIGFVKKIRSSVCPNLGFELQLKEYQKQILKEQISKNLPVSNNLQFFNLLSEPNDMQKINDRNNFPQINSMNQTQSKGKGIARKIIQSKNQQQRSKNMMITTMTGYENVRFRNTFSDIKKQNTTAKDETARKLAKLMFSGNMYKWTPYNKLFQTHLLNLSKPEQKSYYQISKKK